MVAFARFIQFSCLALVLFTVLSGCYRRPGEDEYCVIPATNNPAITRDAGGYKPGVGY